MGKYTCINCGESFKQKSHYEKHLKKKKPCISIQEKLDNIEKVKPALKNHFSKLSKDITKGLNSQIKKKNGIFFTPSNIIDNTIMTVAQYCENNNKTIKRILEPSCGSCEFIKRLSEHYGEDVHIDGIEYVSEIFEKIKNSEFGDKKNIRLLNEDFLKVGEEMYDLIIGNPPYYVMKKTEVDKKYPRVVVEIRSI